MLGSVHCPLVPRQSRAELYEPDTGTNIANAVPRPAKTPISHLPQWPIIASATQDGIDVSVLREGPRL